MDAEFEVAPIFDPNDLIAYLGRARAVSKFWVTFKRPNPFDADTDFQRPLQKILVESGGSKGKAQVEGDNLTVGALEKMARAAAATGDDAAATMILPRERARVQKRLKENPVMLSQEDLANGEQQQTLLARMRDEYRRIRGGP